MRYLCAAVLALGAACSAPAQTYTIRTFAGGAFPDNAAGSYASLGSVTGIAVDQAGNVFLALADYDMVVQRSARTGILTRVAGNGTQGFGGDGGLASSAQLSGPSAIALDSAGNLYIADAGNYRIRMVSNGVITTIAGNGTDGFSGDNGPALEAQFGGLADIAAGAPNTLYIADFYNQVVRKVNGGTITTVAGDGTFGYGGDNGAAIKAQLAGPLGVAVDASGNLYVAEAYNNRVRKVSASGIITTVGGTGVAGFTGDKGAATSATLRQPTGVALDSAGNLYVADYGNNRIRMISASNGIVTTVAGNGSTTFSGDGSAATGAGLVSPQRVALDASASLYIADSDRVRKVVFGIIATLAGGGVPAGENGPAESAQLLSPQGLAVDGAGNLYISDQGTGRVLKVTNGVLSRVAGTGVQGFGGDNGPASGAQLAAPSGIAVDPSGSVYIADSQNSRIRKVSNGLIATVAGGGATFGDNGPATSARLSNPQGVAVDAGGVLYIADLNRIRAVTAGAITTVAGTGGAGYQGDGGPATAAMFSTPSGVAVDSSGGLFIADSNNNRIRKVQDGVASTVAGNGNYGFTGGNGPATSSTLGTPAGVAVDSTGNLYLTDAYRVLKISISKGTISTIAGLNAPQGIAVDAAGNVYVAEPSTHRVHLLAPAGASCSVTATPSSQQALASGGSLALDVQTGASCPWTVEALPAWIAMSGSPFGTGPARVALAVEPNLFAPRSATILVGGQNVTVTQAGSATIAGQVTRAGGAPLPGVSVALSGSQSATAATDSGGYYSFTNLSSTGAYTVTPSLSGYSFVPASLTFSNVTANPTANFVGWPQPRITGVGPAFGSLLLPAPKSYAAGEILAIYGADLCSDATNAAPTLPDRLAGCIVKVDGAAVRLYYASPVQINLVLPQSLALGAHQMVVQRYTDTGYKTLAAQSQAFSFAADKVAMAFVERTEGSSQLLLVQYLDGGLAGAARPLHAGDIVVLYLTGLGRKAKTFGEGAAPKAIASAVEPIEILVEGQTAGILYAGVQTLYPGLDQINVQLPKYTLPAGKSTATFRITAPSAGQTLLYEIHSY